MNAADYATFDRAFGRVLGAFRVRVRSNDRDELSKTYFKILEPFPIDDVLDAGKRCLEKSRKFPLVAEWLDELGGTPTAALPFDYRAMTTVEADELADAARTFYAGPCCTWACCAEIGRPLRFVPTLTEDGVEERAMHPYRHRPEIVGHWAHGDELRRWYAARDHFFSLARPRFRRVLALVCREPGEDDD